MHHDQPKSILFLLMLLIGSSSATEFNLQRSHHQLQAYMQQYQSSDYLIPKKACYIAARYTPKTHYVYTSDYWSNYTAILEQQLLSCLSKKLKYVLNIDVIEQEPARQHDSHNFIIIPEESLQSLQCLNKLSKLLNKQQRCKKCHKYIFLWRNATKQQLLQLFQLVWEKEILHAVAIVDIDSVYTFEPFTAQDLQVVPVVGKYFYDKLRNLHHFQLRISMFADRVRARPTDNPEVDGYTSVDGMVARTIVESLNATVRYIFPADYQYYGSVVNGSYTGALKDITTGVTHVGFNSRFMLDEERSDIEVMYPYDKRVLYLVVPAAEMRPEYLIFVNSFSVGTWRLMLLSFWLVCIVFALIQRCAVWLLQSNRVMPRSWRFYEICEAMVKTQLGQPVRTSAQISALRVFIISWILFSYVLTSIYFAKLESSFVQPTFEEEMNNLDDLDKLTVPIYAIDGVVDAVMPILTPLQRRALQSKVVRLPQNYSSTTYALALSRIKCTAFILRDEVAKDFLASTYNTLHKRPTYHVVRQYMRSMPRSYITALGTPFLYKFQSKVNRFFETGLIEHWYEQGLRRRYNSSEALAFYEDLSDDSDFELADQVTPVDAEHARKVALSLDILQGAFYLWWIGILMSLLGFGVEHVHWWWWQRRLKHRRLSAREACGLEEGWEAPEETFSSQSSSVNS